MLEGVKDEIQSILENPKADHLQAHALAYESLMEVYKFATMKDSGEIYVYNGCGVYSNEGEQVIHKQLAYLYGIYGTINTYKEIKHRIKGDSYVEREEFNNEIDLIPVENGILNIKSKELQSHSPDYKFTFKIPIEYNPEACCPEIEKFIEEVFLPEDQTLAYEAIAYCLYRGMPIQRAIMLLGSGKNGKSVFINLIKAFIGEKNISTRTIQDLVYNRFAASSLYGKLANLNADLPATEITQTGAFKMLTGGDSLNYEKKHKDAGEFKNYAKLIFAANKLPKSKDITYAYFRRWCIIKCPRTFEGEKCDPNKLEKITTPEELSGLLNKCLDILEGMLERGDFCAGNTKNIEREYIRESDSILAFFNECIVRDVDAEPILKSELYVHYKKFCDFYELDIDSDSKFGRDLKEFASWVGERLIKKCKGWCGFKVCEDYALTTTDTTEFSHNIMHDAQENIQFTEKNSSSGNQNTPEINHNKILIIIRDNKGLLSEEDLLLKAGAGMEIVRPILTDLAEKGLIYSPKFGFWSITDSGCGVFA